MNWEKLAPLRTMLLALAGFVLIAVCAFMSPWPFVGYGVLGIELVLMAYLTDPSETRR